MIKEGKFGLQEAICLIVIVNANKVLFTSPGIIVRLVGTAGWYMTLISSATAAAGFTFVYLLLKRFPGKNIIEVFEIVMGSYLGFVFSLIFAVLFLFESGITLREYEEVLRVYVLPNTPLWLITGMFIAGTVTASLLGLETLVRVARISAYYLLAGLVAVLIMGGQNYEYHRLFPILGRGIDKTLYHGFVRSSVYADAIILAVVAGSVQTVKNIKKAGYISIVISGILVSAALITFSLTFPYHMGGEVTAPIYQMAALIDYGRFVQRVESVFIFTWTISSFIAVTALFYTGVSIYCKMFRIQDVKPVALSLAIVLFSIVMLPHNISQIATGYIQDIREYAWTIYYIPPFIVFIISVIRRKGGRYTV